jgi:large subunit ribosomal protein L15
VQLSELAERFDGSEPITPELMVERGMIKKSHLTRFDGVVVLGGGELTAKLSITAHRFTKSAKEKIEAAGGTASLVGKSFEA